MQSLKSGKYVLIYLSGIHPFEYGPLWSMGPMAPLEWSERTFVLSQKYPGNAAPRAHSEPLNC